MKRYITGYRPIVHASQGFMLGIRQPLDGPVFDKLEHAEYWCWYAMIDHYDRRRGMSDATIELFKGMVHCGSQPTDPAQLRDIERICQEVARERLSAKQEPGQ